MYTCISPYWDRFARKKLLLTRSESALHSLHSEQRSQTCSFSSFSTLSTHVPRLQLVQHIFDDYLMNTPQTPEQRSKFHMYSSHLPLTRIHACRKLFPDVRKVSVRSAVSHA